MWDSFYIYVVKILSFPVKMLYIWFCSLLPFLWMLIWNLKSQWMDEWMFLFHFFLSYSSHLFSFTCCSFPLCLFAFENNAKTSQLSQNCFQLQMSSKVTNVSSACYTPEATQNQCGETFTAFVVRKGKKNYLLHNK